MLRFGEAAECYRVLSNADPGRSSVLASVIRELEDVQRAVDESTSACGDSDFAHAVFQALKRTRHIQLF